MSTVLIVAGVWIGLALLVAVLWWRFHSATHGPR